MKLNYADTSLDVSSNGNTFILTFDDQKIQAEVIHSNNGRLELLIDGQRVTAYVSSQNSKRWVTVNGQTTVLTQSSGARPRGHGHHPPPGELTAPMPGQVRSVNANEGDKVIKGQTLMLLEAMKMEIRIQSPQDGVVKKLFVSQGQTVEREQRLIEIVETLEG